MRATSLSAPLLWSCRPPQACALQGNPDPALARGALLVAIRARPVDKCSISAPAYAQVRCLSSPSFSRRGTGRVGEMALRMGLVARRSLPVLALRGHAELPFAVKSACPILDEPPCVALFWRAAGEAPNNALKHRAPLASVTMVLHERPLGEQHLPRMPTTRRLEGQV